MVFIYEESKLSNYFIEGFDFNFVKVDHDLKPFNHGFDAHWNETGRYNCAKSILKFLEDRIKIE